MKNKEISEYIYYGLGFPVILRGFPMKQYWGEKMPDINYDTLKKVVIEVLAKKAVGLTGNELRFIRQYFEMTYTEFGKHFGQTRQAVAKWEAKGDEYASITRSTELHIRLTILDFIKTNDKIFRQSFHKFDQSEVLKNKKPPHEVSPISLTPSELKQICA